MSGHIFARMLTMKRYLLITATLLNAGLMMAQKLTPTDEGSTIKFTIKNFGVNVGGSFGGMTGDINFDPASLQSASFNVSVDANTVNTGIELRDEHLRKHEYFDVQNYPRIKFTSTEVSKGRKDGSYLVAGKLTIKDVTKDIAIPFTATTKENGYQFEGEFKIDRRDYNVGGGSLTLSDNATIHLSVFAKK